MGVYTTPEGRVVNTAFLPAQHDDSGNVPVASPAEVVGVAVQDIIRDQSLTMSTVNFPSGAKVLAISYRLLTGATGATNQFVRYVVNAASDADATGRLATDGAFIPLFQGDDHVLAFNYGSLATRIDFISSVAASTEKTIISIRGIV